MIGPKTETIANATHKASFYGIPCWWDDKTSTLWGRGRLERLWDALIPVASWIHDTVNLTMGLDSEFPIKVWDLDD
jgi:hypothetical protein